MSPFACKSFSQLSATELYSIMQLRNEVFVVEQHCPYQDADNKDFQSFHLMFHEGDILVAYARLIPAGIAFAETSIGRVVTKKEFRKQGFGKILFSTAVAECHRIFGIAPIRIGAQLYLKNFYSSFNFTPDSNIYMEDGIPHIEMVLSPQ